MPKFRRNKYRTKRKRYGRKSKSHAIMRYAKSFNPYSKTPFPKVNRINMRYIQYINLNPGVSGTISEYVFRANSISDPDYTSVLAGHQPMGHDQWSEFYQNYRVVGSKIIVKFLNDQSSNDVFLCGVTTSNVPFTGYSDPITVAEQGASRYILRTGANNQSPSVNVLTSKFSPRKQFDVVDIKDNSELTAQFGDNPSRQAYFVVWVGCPNAVDGVNVECMVTIEYIVDLINPVQNMLPS